MTGVSISAFSASSILVRRLSPKVLTSVLDLVDHQIFQSPCEPENLLQRLLLLALFVELLLDFDVLELGQLPQPHLENVLGLALGQLERLDQLGLGIVGIADDLDHLVHVEQHDHAPLEHVDAVEHLVQLVLGAARDRGEAEAAPTRT